MFATRPFRAVTAAGIAARSLGRPAAAFPGRVATDADLMIAVDRQQTRLALPLNASDTSMTVVDPSSIGANNLLTIDAEIVRTTGAPTGNVVPISRGFDGTTPVVHLASAVVSGFVDAWHHNALTAEIEAIEQALGPNLSKVPSYPVLVSSAFDWPAQAPGGSLVVGANSIALSPVPLGVNGTNVGHYVYISGGTGTAEAALIIGGTAVSGAASGTLIVQCANTHSGAWTVRSATAGIQEAIYAYPGINDCIAVPPGTSIVYSPIRINRNDVAITGAGGRSSTKLDYRGSGSMFTFDRGGTVLSGACIYGMMLMGANSTASWAITMTDVNTLQARDLYILQFASGIQIGGLNTFDVHIENVNVSYMAKDTGVGVFINGGGGHYMQNCIVAGGGAGQHPFAGVRVQQTGGYYISKCDLMQTGIGILIDPGPGQDVNFGWCTDCSFDTCSNWGISIQPTGTGSIIGLSFTSCWSSTCGLDGVQITKEAASTVDTVQFIGHRSYNNGNHGYIIYAGIVNLMLTDCQAMGNSRTTAGAKQGLVIAGASKFQIIGGIYAQGIGFPNTQDFGIFIIAAPSDDYTILGAVVTPNLTGGISDGGSGLNKVIRMGAGQGNLISPLTAAASLDLGFNDEEMFSIVGATTVLTILRGWRGRRVRFFKLDAGTLTIGGGGNVPLAHSLVQNGAIDLTFDGSSWY